MRIALCQINTRQGDFGGNAAAILHAAARAKDDGAEVLVFPELSLIGYCPRDLVYRQSFAAAAEAALQDLARRLDPGLHVIVGCLGSRLEGADARPFNGAAHLHGGRVCERTEKTLLPNYDVFDEARWFRAGNRREPWSIAGRRLGVTICEDIWVDEGGDPGMPRYDRDPAAELARAGADCILNLSASPYEIGKPGRRAALVQRTARRVGLPVILVNLVGGNDELVFDGHSLGVDAAGRALVRAPGFDEAVVCCDLPAGTRSAAPAVDELGVEKDADLEEIRSALVLGIRDYAAKSGFESAVLGLSGGIDSALTAVLACQALGAGRVRGVAMPSRYSDPISRADAADLAQRLGMGFDELPIEPGFEAILDTLARADLGPLGSLTEENIQPRLRGLLLMALSNQTGALLLSTGNKSEIAVGYCTLYGDMCGGLAAISDLPKTTVYRLSRHLNRRFGAPIPERTLTRPPTAELRPGQKDTDSLPDYDVLDDILRRSIEELEGRDRIVAAGHDPAVVDQVLERVWRNEYKRKQMPIGIRITGKAFGAGRRMPITGSRRWYETGGQGRPNP